MRMAFGLVGLLVVSFIVIYMMASNAQQVSTTAKEVRPKAEQIAGRDETGQAVTDALTVAERQRNGQLDGVTVTAISSGALATHYGLQANDVVLEAGNFALSSPYTTDADQAKAYILSAYQQNQNLVVLRNGAKVVLPTTIAPAVPPASSGTPQGQADALKRQLEGR